MRFRISVSLAVLAAISLLVLPLMGQKQRMQAPPVVQPQVQTTALPHLTSNTDLNLHPYQPPAGAVSSTMAPRRTGGR